MVELLDERNRARKRQAICWFSAGATSAVACKIASEMFERVRIIYIETGQAHDDNERFLSECETWIGQKIEIHRSEKYTSPLDVASKRRFLNGPSGALCTVELKKNVRYKIESELECGVDAWNQVYGFEFSKKEVNRAIRFSEQNPATNPVFPLIDRMLTKPNCLAMLKMAGINPPKMYELGYHNNNCLGCFKGGMGYWNKIRKDFPEIFRRTSEVEREIGRSCIRGVFLDELDPSSGRHDGPIMAECGVVCAIEFEHIESPVLEDVMTGKLKL